MLHKNSPRRVLMLLAPLLLVMACKGSLPPTSPQSVEPARNPTLPPEARVSLVPIPSICSPSCTAGVTALREQSRTTLMSSPSGAPAANGSPTDYSLPRGSWPKP